MNIEKIPLYIHVLPNLTYIPDITNLPGIHYAIKSITSMDYMDPLKSVLHDYLQKYIDKDDLKVPCGINRIVSLIDTQNIGCRFNAAERDTLYNLGYCPLYFFPGHGIAIWGARFISKNGLFHNIVETDMVSRVSTVNPLLFELCGEKVKIDWNKPIRRIHNKEAKMLYYSDVIYTDYYADRNGGVRFPVRYITFTDSVTACYNMDGKLIDGPNQAEIENYEELFTWER